MATSQTNFLISLAMLSKCVTLRQFEVVGFKVKEIRHIALFVISGSVRKFSVIDCVNICLSFHNIFSTNFIRWKSVELPYIAYIVIHNFNKRIQDFWQVLCKVPNDNEIIQKGDHVIFTFIYCSESVCVLQPGSQKLLLIL